MKPAVIARVKIDNYLLSLPHVPELYTPFHDGKIHGGLFDTTFYGI